MFYGTREHVKDVLDKLQKDLCCYMGPICDCKYGYPGGPKANGKGLGNVPYHGEKTGCPELRCAWAILENITDEEYEAILCRPRDRWRAEACQGEGI